MSELVGRTLKLLAETKGGFVSAVKNIFNTRSMATLKINELSVGDWVLMNGEPAKALRLTMAGRTIFKGQSGQIYGSVGGDIFPLPITPEILEANGLFRHLLDVDNPYLLVLSNHFMMARTYEDAEWWRVLIYDEEMPSRELFNGRVYYVHQLQHALRLAGVDKEIVMPNK